MKIFIDEVSLGQIEKLKKERKSLDFLEGRNLKFSIKDLVSSDLSNIYSKLIDSETISFFLRSPQQINFFCKQVSKDFVQNPINLRIGLNELLMNSLEHGNFQIDKETKNTMISAGAYYDLLENLVETNSTKYIEVQYKLTSPKKIIIIDQGVGFEYKTFLEENSIEKADYCGRGIYIASLELPKNNAEFIYKDKGNKLEINFR